MSQYVVYLKGSVKATMHYYAEADSMEQAEQQAREASRRMAGSRVDRYRQRVG
jgi:hypothetical protein